MLWVLFEKSFYKYFLEAILMTNSEDAYIGRTIQCYKCSGKSKCGTSFPLRLSNNTEYLTYPVSELLFSCSVSRHDYKDIYI